MDDAGRLQAYLTHETSVEEHPFGGRSRRNPESRIIQR
jgi:hypothetical protein